MLVRHLNYYLYNICIFKKYDTLYCRVIILIQEVQVNSPHPHRRELSVIPLNLQEQELGDSFYRDRFKGPLSNHSL